MGVFCCGYEFPKGVKGGEGSVISTWALATRPKARCPAWLANMLVWEASDPYLYIRMGQDRRLIAGGEDEGSPTAHANAAKLGPKCESIARKLQVLLPGLDIAVDYRWAGAFGQSSTGLPSIAPVPGIQHAWAVMGFGGNGITYSVIASEIVGAAVRGTVDPDAGLYPA